MTLHKPQVRVVLFLRTVNGKESCITIVGQVQHDLLEQLVHVKAGGLGSPKQEGREGRGEERRDGNDM